jgi:hypothetical protein
LLVEEIAAFGIVKTAGTLDRLLALARDVQKFRQVPQIPEMGYFSSPAKIEDLKGLNHPPVDTAALKKCKPGSCDVKIGTKGLEAVSKIDWSGADAEKRAVAIFNQAVVEYVVAYQQGGTDAMGATHSRPGRAGNRIPGHGHRHPAGAGRDDAPACRSRQRQPSQGLPEGFRPGCDAPSQPMPAGRKGRLN